MMNRQNCTTARVVSALFLSIALIMSTGCTGDGSPTASDSLKRATEAATARPDPDFPNNVGSPAEEPKSDKPAEKPIPKIELELEAPESVRAGVAFRVLMGVTNYADFGKKKPTCQFDAGRGNFKNARLTDTGGREQNVRLRRAGNLRFGCGIDGVQGSYVELPAHSVTVLSKEDPTPDDPPFAVPIPDVYYTPSGKVDVPPNDCPEVTERFTYTRGVRNLDQFEPDQISCEECFEPNFSTGEPRTCRPWIPRQEQKIYPGIDTWRKNEVTCRSASGVGHDFIEIRPIPCQPCIDCPAPPKGCHYEGGSCTTCGELVCPSCEPVSYEISVQEELEEGQQALIEWRSENATVCEASGDWSGVKAANGTEFSPPLKPGQYNFCITCRDVDCPQFAPSQARCVTTTVVAPPEPDPVRIRHIDAYPRQVCSADDPKTNITATVEGEVEGCHAYSVALPSPVRMQQTVASASAATNSAKRVMHFGLTVPVTETADWHVACWNQSSHDDRAVTVVLDPPECNVPAPPTVRLTHWFDFNAGGCPLYIGYEATNVTSCVATGGPLCNQATGECWVNVDFKVDANGNLSGQANFDPPNSDTTITLECIGPGGKGQDVIIVGPGKA